MLSPSSPCATPSTRDRLISASLRLLERDGLRGLSSRSLSRETELSISAMNYTFGGRRGLIAAVAEAAALKAHGWWARQAQFLPEGGDVRAVANWLGVAISEGWRDPELPRLGVNELLLAAAWDPDLGPILAEQRRRNEALWVQIAGRAGLPPSAGACLEQFVAGALLNYVPPGRAGLETPWMLDVCARLLARLRGQRTELPGWSGWSRMSHQDLDAAPDSPPPSAPMERMLSAVFTLCASGGLQAVTHRAVASVSGCTLATVVYHYPTSEALIRGAFDAAVQRVLSRGDAWRLGPSPAEGIDSAMAVAIQAILEPDGAPNVQSTLLATLLVEAWRDADLGRLAIRLIQRSEALTLAGLQALAPDKGPDRLDARIRMLSNRGAVAWIYTFPQAERCEQLRTSFADPLRMLFD